MANLQKYRVTHLWNHRITAFLMVRDYVSDIFWSSWGVTIT